ncbi:MAG: SRPBCC family protein [Candidatus Obscuribacterales bacterium]|jgi:uncharacterized membrane protein|nr:SRPBCC family protein [Candidatus Obscuribacterales bacterium]
MRCVKESNALSFVLAAGMAFFSVAHAPASLAKQKAAVSSSVATVGEEKIGNRTYQVSRILVKAKPDVVWQILTDYDNAPYIFPCIKKCRVVKDRGRSKLVEHEICPRGVPGSFDYVLEIKETANKLQEWHRISGDFHEVDGFIKLESGDDGASTHVTYASYVNGGFFIPQALIKRQVRMDIPSVMAALKTHAESSGKIAIRRIDSATQTP